jgi:uncharacterized repeat protein (TIGR02543 family)
MSKWKQKIACVLALCIAVSSESIVTLATAPSQTIAPVQNENDVITPNIGAESEETSLDNNCETTDTLNAGEQSTVDEKLPSFNVKFESEFGQVPVDEAYVSSSIIVTLPLLSAEGVTFLGWYKDQAFLTAWNYETDTVTQDITLYAKWEIDKIKDYSYTLEDNIITLTKYSGTESNVIVPQTLIVDGKEYVVKVTEDTFIPSTSTEDKETLNDDLTPTESITNKGNETETSIVIPDDKSSDTLVSSTKEVVPNVQENNCTQDQSCISTPNISADKASPGVTSTISLNVTSLKLGKGKAETLTATVSPSNSPIAWTTSNAGVATVDSNGKVTATNYGSATITATLQDGSGLSASANVVVGANITYVLNNGTNHRDNPSVYYNETVDLRSPTREGYVFSGWYSDENYKKNISKISDNQEYTIYAKWDKISLSRPRISSLTNKKGKKLIVKIRKLNGVSGYEILYSTDRNFKKDCTTVSTAVVKTTINSLTKRKFYYVKARAFVIDSTGKRVYGNYGVVKKIKIKK